MLLLVLLDVVIVPVNQLAVIVVHLDARLGHAQMLVKQIVILHV